MFLKLPNYVIKYKHSRFVFVFPDNSLSMQNDKTDDSKMNDNTLTSSANSASGVNKSSIGTNCSPNMNATEKVKDNIKEETAALKD